MVARMCFKRRYEMQKSNNQQTLNQKLKSKIFGQDEAIDLLGDYISISIAGLNDKDKPLGSFLFTGPTGVGKTELAKQLANELDMHFERFDMSEYSTGRSSDNLIGGAAGLVGYEEGGLLTNAIIRHPECVLLFDEIEKAHRQVINKFLQVLDYGKLTSSKGEKAYFDKTIIIFTSNLNGVSTERRTVGFDSSTFVEYENSMDEFLSPEFKARINQIIHFNPLDDFTSRLIVEKSFMQINEMLEDKHIQALATDVFVGKVLELSNRNLGARNVQNIITKYVKTAVSQEILLGNIGKNAKIIFDWDEEKDNSVYTIEQGDTKPKHQNTDFRDVVYFDNAYEAQEYARENIGFRVVRADDGVGFLVKATIR